MKNRNIMRLLVLMMALVMTLFVASCDLFTTQPQETTPEQTTPEPTTPPHVHTEEVIPAVAPTCTEKGLTEGKKCSDCGEILVPQEEVAALGHTEEAVAGKDATCTETGLTEGTKCSVCGEVLKAQEEIPAKGHTEETVAGKEATCTETGLTEGKKCSVCGETLVAQETIPAKGHTEEVVTGKEATCTEPGLTEGKKCSVCGTVLVPQTEIPAKGHTEEVVPGTAASCTEAGLTDGKKCSVCGVVLEAQQPIAAAGHTYDDNYDEECNVCGFVREADCRHDDVTVLEAVAATCTSTGLTEGKICNKCQELLVKQEVVDALPHTEEVIPGKDATCVESGLTEGKKCSVCGTVTVAQEVIPAAHTVVDGKCTVCGYIPVFENASVYDNDGDGVNESYFFTPILPERFAAEDAVHVWAGDYIVDMSSSYVSSASFNDIRHWYCTEGNGEFFTIKVEVAECGIYEMAIHMRMKDSKERGTKYTVNEGTANEYTFETSFQFATDEDAFAARENDYTMSSYMFGIQVELQAGDNYIKIEESSKSPKAQHFRDFYFVKEDETVVEEVDE